MNGIKCLVVLLRMTVMKQLNSILILTVGLIFFACQSKKTIIKDDKFTTHFVYENEVTKIEKFQVETWIRFVQQHAENLLGEFQFNLQYHIHVVPDANSAVVFGYVYRSDTLNGVHFYFGRDFDLAQYKEDWIIPHEISHLAIPALPYKDKWFFEGFATYMSREIMHEMNVLTRVEVDSINQARIQEHAPVFTSNSTVEFVTDSLMKNHIYAPVYWIGANFIYQLNDKLFKQKNRTLAAIVNEYQKCCFKNKMAIDELMKIWDDVSDTKICSEHYTFYKTTAVKYLMN